MKRLGLLVLIALGGCDLYFGDGDDDPCAYDGYGTGAEPAANMLRNPYTGTCEAFGGYYPPCDDKCGPCAYPADDSDGGVPPQTTDGGSAPDGMTGTGSGGSGGGSGTADLAPLPNWAQCYSSCDGLDERSCIAQGGCQAAYDEFGPYADAPGVQNFKGCWATAPQYTAPAVSCWDLGAEDCSQREDCSPYFTSYGAPNELVAPEFARCAPEPTTSGCAAVDCGPGSHCEEQCYPCDGQNGQPCDSACAPMCVPDSYSCAAVDCGPGYTCVEQCNTMDPTAGGMLPPGECYPTCVPTTTGDPGACTGPVNCLTGEPACPTGTVAGILDGCWTGYCIPEAACGPSDPGTCGEPLCDEAPPACPAGTVPGVGASSCWSGYCIPESACPAALCEALTTESACAARFDCTAVYTGDNCTCTPNGCSCTDLAFARCESWGDQPMPL